ncbi:MAG: glycosyltransferase [Deltaproteobacteria bacterium]|nr:glycosyltransferase [Deltaproteobacteria bacterium]
MKKRIVILDTGKEWGGGTESLLALLKRLDRSEYEFSAVFYANYKKGSGSDIRTELERQGVDFTLIERPEKSLYAKAIKEAARTLLSLSPRLKKKSIFYIDYMERILPSALRLAEVLRSKKADLLYMNNQPSSNLEGILAARDAGIPCVQHARIEVKLNKVEAEAVNRTVEKVICVSKGVMDTLVKSGVHPDKCTVIYNGIDGSLRPERKSLDVKKSLGIGQDAVVVGTAGSLVKRKRGDLLLKAFGELRDAENTFCLVVGDGPEFQSLKALSSRLGIRDKVIFTGFSADALSFVNCMDIFILASGKEGFPRVILEAMLLKKPVIAFDVVGPSELVIDGKTGLLLKNDAPFSLAPAIKDLLNNRPLMSSMGEAGHKRVLAEFGMERYISGVEGVFKGVLR